MANNEKRLFLIKELLSEVPQSKEVEIPKDTEKQKRLLRSLMNIRPPRSISSEFLKVQDEYLSKEVEEKGIVDGDTLAVSPVNNRLVLWRGDITTLKTDAIVNAANHALRGCFVPCHSCVDNVIHSVSGIQLRLACDMMNRQERQKSRPHLIFHVSMCFIQLVRLYQDSLQIHTVYNWQIVTGHALNWLQKMT